MLFIYFRLHIYINARRECAPRKNKQSTTQGELDERASRKRRRFYFAHTHTSHVRRTAGGGWQRECAVSAVANYIYIYRDMFVLYRLPCEYGWGDSCAHIVTHVTHTLTHKQSIVLPLRAGWCGVFWFHSARSRSIIRYMMMGAWAVNISSALGGSQLVERAYIYTREYAWRHIRRVGNLIAERKSYCYHYY